MADLHVTSTLISTPVSAPNAAQASTLTQAAGAQAGAVNATDAATDFSNLLAGRMGLVAPDAAEAAVAAAIPAAGAEPRETKGKDGSDVAHDAAPADPDAAMQMLIAMGLLPPEAAAKALPANMAVAVPGGASGAAGGVTSSGASPRSAGEAPGTGSTGNDGRSADSARLVAARDASESKAAKPDALASSLAAAGEKTAMERPAAAEFSATSNLVSAHALTEAQTSATNPLGGAAQPAAALPPAPIHVVTVPSQVGTHAWREEFASSVNLLATQRVSSAEIHVQPAELGPVQVNIRIEGGETSMSFSAPHADTRQALEAAMPRLREMLEANGISLGSANVGAESFGQGSPQAFADSQPRSRAAPPVNDAEPLAATRTAVYANQLVDTFA